ncbi:MAG: TetR/AcrR family transcriptional regulator C-terminal domain-containing protein [Bryobacteraceae bacterium]
MVQLRSGQARKATGDVFRLAVSEAPRFPAAAEGFFTHGPHQAAAAVKALISHFWERGQFRDCDQERTSRAFVSMLRGNLYQEIVLGCRTEPDERELESRTKAVVEVFLRGANRLVKRFEARNAEGKIRMKEPEIAARQFIGMIRADTHLAARLTGKKYFTQHSEDCDNAIQTVMNGAMTKGQQA